MSGGRDRAGIDWAAVRDRLAQAIAATEQELNPPPERIREILQERARALAREAGREPPPQDGIEVVAFQIAGERYALETAYVREVRRPRSFTPVPGAPDLIGIVEVHGEIVALLDFRRLVGLAPAELKEPVRLIIVGRSDSTFGFPVDEIQGVERVPLDDVASGPDTDSASARHYFLGLASKGLQILNGAEIVKRGNLTELGGGSKGE